MGFTYTKDQEKVINTRGCNILVSAAAGSGKTAVLVERIIAMITNKEKLIPIDELLIVTFTHAAASEMKERIGNGIEKAIENSSDELVLNHLIKQLTLLSAANIMTLHSFCLKVIKNYYHIIDLDPSFRIGNETELVLIKEEVIEELLEEEYELASEAFIQVVESYASGKNDEPLKDLIFQIYRFAMSNPWPDEWFDSCKLKLEINSLDDYIKSPYFVILQNMVVEKLSLMDGSFRELNDLMEQNEGPDKYMDTVSALYELMESISEGVKENNYKEVKNLYMNRSIPALSRKSKGYDKELAGLAKDIINDIKKSFEMVELICFDEELVLGEAQIIKKNIYELIRLTRRFREMYASGKQNKNLIDFNDIEHFALKLLYEDGKLSSIANSLSESFVEVLVDEYQDTNEVQEAILLSVSKQDEEHNLFMVGDLKQSIYKFRLAKPEIFRDKYERFTYDQSVEVKIDLAKNFRSRREVVDFSNLIFEKVMSKDIGDVDYNDITKLNYGAMNFEETSEGTYKSELIFVEQGDSKESKATLEASVMVSKIKSLVLDHEIEIYDKEIQGLRPVEYKDICILMRSPASTIEDVKTVFDNEDIPYVSDVSSGYFDAIEVQIILNLLRVIDNPFQDIPLVSVLRSALVNISEKELMTIRAYIADVSFYEALVAFNDGEVEDELTELGNKVNKFLLTLEELKRKSFVIPLDELIEDIYYQTGYPFFVQFMENGEQRLTNLKYLKTQASSFEQSSYKGLFNFIRYIEHIKKYEIEIPEPMTSSETTGVTLMSIHKSKGLEFPIVFLIDIHKQFNMMDLRKSFVIHQDLGFGSDYFEPENRLRKESIFSQGIKVKSGKELLSEELRLLYVALTRAKEKLYLFGVVKDYEDKVLPIQESYLKYINEVPSYEVEKAKCYLDLILMCCPPSGINYKQHVISPISMDEQVSPSLEVYHELKLEKIDLLKRSNSLEVSVEDLNKFEQIFDPYPYAEQSGKYITLSVSELKANKNKIMLQEETYESPNSLEGSKEKTVPEFIKKTDKTLKGAAYGLVMHKVLSLLEPKLDYTFEELKSFVDDLFAKEILENEYVGKIYIKPILEFTKSDFYKRIVKSFNNHKCFREQPFVLGIVEEGDTRMIQGVIDLYFEEEGELILLDYKTDYIEEDESAVLVERYTIQLDYYQSALEEITGLKVSERYIFSLSISELIEL